MRTYLGRNIHCGYPAVAARATCVPAVSLDAIRDAQNRIVGLLPDVTSTEFLAMPDLSGRAVDATAALGAMLAWLTAQLQNLGNGCVSDAGSARTADGKAIVLCGYQVAEVAIMAMHLAAALLAECCAAEAGNVSPVLNGGVQQRLAGFLDFARTRHFDVQTYALVSAARARNIPYYRLCSFARFVQLGQGVHLQHVYETVSDRTSEAGAKIAHNKVAAHHLLRNLGVPVPAQFDVTTLEQATAAADRLAFPVVVKPTHGMQARGVTVGVTNPQELKTACEKAAAAGLGGVLVEKFVPGFHHRLTVIDGRLITAVKWIPAHVVGDGVHDVERLIALANQDPRRGVDHGYEFDFGRRRVRIARNSEMDRMLAARGYGYASIPPQGEMVFLHGTTTIASGGDGLDVSDRVHPDVRDMAELIARAFKLDAIGIDYLTHDIALSYRDGAGAVCEVNACPGFQGHFLIGIDRGKILEALLERTFTPGATGRVPVVAIAASAHSANVARMVAHMLETSGKSTALAWSGGVMVGARRIHSDDSSGGERARALMFDPRVEAAVLEIGDGSLLATGMPLDSCDVAAVLGVDRAQSQPDGLTTAEEVRALHALVPRSASRCVVLNAEDAACVSIAAQLTGVLLCWVSASADNAVLKKHRDANGMTVTLEGEGDDAVIVMAKGSRREQLAAMRDLPPVRIAAISRIEVLFAAAIAGALGLPPADIRTAVSSYRGNSA